jgi:hypothetical protein
MPILSSCLTDHSPSSLSWKTGRAFFAFLLLPTRDAIRSSGTGDSPGRKMRDGAAPAQGACLSITTGLSSASQAAETRTNKQRNTHQRTRTHAHTHRGNTHTQRVPDGCMQACLNAAEDAAHAAQDSASTHSLHASRRRCGVASKLYHVSTHASSDVQFKMHYNVHNLSTMNSAHRSWFKHTAHLRGAGPRSKAAGPVLQCAGNSV